MGILAQRFEQRSRVQDWLNDDDEWSGQSTPSGVRVNAQVALGLTTIWRCVDILSSAVAQSPKDVNIKIGGKSFPQFQKPSWLIMPNPSDPTYTADDYFGQVVVSLLLDGNYFVHAYPNVLDPQVLTVLPPSRVEVHSGPVYEIRNASGRVTNTLTPMEMLHGTWIRLPGALRGISPLETLRRGIGSAVAAEDFGGRFFGHGASLSFGVEVPGTLTDPQKIQLSEALKKKHAGTANSHAIGILTGGAKFVSGLAPTPEQAQMLATRKFSVEDLCRPFGVPPHMVGSQEPGASSYASADVNREVFVERGVIPLAVRVESQHSRLLSVPATVTDPNASAQFRFNLDGISRGNIQQRYTAYQLGINSGMLRPNEARDKEDLQPAAGGDRLYMQAQMIPIDQLGMTPAVPAEPATGKAA